MAKQYSPAALDLGLGDGDQLSGQMSLDEEERKKKLAQLSQQTLAGGQMGLAAQTLLGSFRGY